MGLVGEVIMTTIVLMELIGLMEHHLKPHLCGSAENQQDFSETGKLRALDYSNLSKQKPVSLFWTC
jgi:hypothetical protein